MEFMAPKLDAAISSVERLVGQTLDIPKVCYCIIMSLALSAAVCELAIRLHVRCHKCM